MSSYRHGEVVGERVRTGMYVFHERLSFECVGPSKARQEFKKETDVNELMRRFKKTGVLPVNGVAPKFLDCCDVPQFQEAMQVMLDATEAFRKLPAIVRKEFDNDAEKFVVFAQDKENIGKLREWGLAAPEKAPDAPMRVEVVNPPPSPTAGS